MGMYDSVIREPVKCPKCGKELNDFQSKSGHNLLLEVTPEQLVEDCREEWDEGVKPEYYDHCLHGCGGVLVYTFDFETEIWTHKYMTQEEWLNGARG